MVWSVAGLVQAVADALAGRFSVCAVRGELSGFSRASSGHCYFCLKDAEGHTALIRCAMFRRAASLLDFSPADGQLVELRGRMAVYEPRGELQFVVEAMQRAGAGALYELFLRLQAKLTAEGLFDATRKRELPAYPRRIGVVTSLAAAALHDVVSSFQRRAPHVEIVVYPSLVQGIEAPAALVAAIEKASQQAIVDVVLVCRGGGSLEDLWAFNDERVVRAIAACSVPVVSGVGHETDVTLSDFAADVRAPTPTAAAELVVAPRQECQASLSRLQHRMQDRLRHVLDLHAQRLDTCSLRLARPSRMVTRQGHVVQLLCQRLAASMRRNLDHRMACESSLKTRWQQATRHPGARQKLQLDALAARLNGVDPKRVLARGYAWLADLSGTPVQSVHQLANGQELEAVMADGAARVKVVEKSSDHRT